LIKGKKKEPPAHSSLRVNTAVNVWSGFRILWLWVNLVNEVNKEEKTEFVAVRSHSLLST
jgi:hypothetical protein